MNHTYNLALTISTIRGEHGEDRYLVTVPPHEFSYPDGEYVKVLLVDGFRYMLPSRDGTMITPVDGDNLVKVTPNKPREAQPESDIARRHRESYENWEASCGMTHPHRRKS